MSPFAQEVLVFAIVGASAFYAALKLMPAALRKRLAARVAIVAAAGGLSQAHARRVEAKLATGGACGRCDSCNACARPAAEFDAEAPPTSSTARRTIPIRAASSVDAARR